MILQSLNQYSLALSHHIIIYSQTFPSMIHQTSLQKAVYISYPDTIKAPPTNIQVESSSDPDLKTPISSFTLSCHPLSDKLHYLSQQIKDPNQYYGVSSRQSIPNLQALVIMKCYIVVFPSAAVIPISSFFILSCIPCICLRMCPTSSPI